MSLVARVRSEWLVVKRVEAWRAMVGGFVDSARKEEKGGANSGE